MKTGTRTIAGIAGLVLCVTSTAALAQHRRQAIAVPWADGLAPTGSMNQNPHHDDGGIAGGTLGPQGAGDHVISLQCGNGGWNWPHGGCGTTFNNITGPICEGLLQGYASTGDPDFLSASVSGGNYDLTYQYGNLEYRFSSFTPAFLRRLTLVSGNPAYSAHAETKFFDELTAGTYGPSNLDTAGWIAAVQAGRTGSQINLRPWDFHQMPWVAGQIGNAGQQTLFRNAVLDGLNTLDRTSPGTVYYDLLGLAGGIRGLALNGTTSFPAVAAPNFAPINGMTTLCALAGQLAAYQNGDGSWYWHSNLLLPGISDEDTQTTAYAVLALIAAQDAGCGPYTSQIAQGRAWLASMQDVDGGYFEYPTAGTHNIEVDGEALWARAVGSSLALTAPSCNTGSTVTVAINKSVTTMEVVGGQFFLQYDNTRLDFVSATPGSLPYTQQVYESVNEGLGTIDYAVGVEAPTPGATANTDMVILTFNRIGNTCSTANLVSFRSHSPPTQLTDADGNPILPVLNNLPSITIDSTPPVITCPPNISINADAGSCSAANVSVLTFSTNPVLSPTQAPGVWYTDRYPPSGFASAAFDGDSRLKHSINASDCSTCRPPAYSSAFYDTQGRKYDTPGSVVMAIDLYVPAAWASTGRRMAGFWGTGFDSTNAVSSFPIIEFTDSPDGSGLPRFRGWDNGVWIDMGLPTGFVYNAWYRLKIELVGPNWRYTVGNLTQLVTADGSVQIANVILQGHNTAAGVTYDIYWDNFTFRQTATASDNCTASPVVVGVRSDAQPLDAPYPQGVTTITWTATDACGNSTPCLQTVTVSGFNEVAVNVDLRSVWNVPSSPMNISRCIRFEVYKCANAPVVVNQVVNFSSAGTGFPATGGTTLLVPCGGGPYDCITARDRLHTLRRTANGADSNFGISGPVYAADFTTAGTNDLIGGNLNDDAFIDILDFGVFVGQYLVPTSASTTCSTPFPHADISGNGSVYTEDYTFIQASFLLAREADCCTVLAQVMGPEGQPGDGSDGGPITRISVKELIRRGMNDLVVADLNHDGWLDDKDIAVFLNGGH